MFIYSCFLTIILLVPFVMIVITDGRENMILVLFRLATVALYGLTWVAGKRFKEKMTFIIVGLFTVEQFLILAQIKHIEDPMTIIIATTPVLVLFILLLAPSWNYIIIYMGVFTFNTILILSMNIGFENTTFITLAFYRTIPLFISSTFWYILQKRELLRFLEQLEVIKK